MDIFEQPYRAVLVDDRFKRLNHAGSLASFDKAASSEEGLTDRGEKFSWLDFSFFEQVFTTAREPNPGMTSTRSKNQSRSESRRRRLLAPLKC